MRKFYSLLTLVLLSVSLFAQSPQKMSYQAVIRNSSDQLVSNKSVGMRISILQGSVSGAEVYKEIYNPNPQTNVNGLVTVEIGSGVALVGTFLNIDWSAGPYFIKSETDPTGGTSYTITGTSELLSVPFALYAKTAENGFSGSYNDLTDTPTLFDGQYSSLTGTPILASVATSGSYSDLSNKPVIFDGVYNSLTGKPILFDGNYNSLTNKPSLFDGAYGSLTGVPTLFDGNYNSLTNKPVLFNGAYNSLTGIPTFATVATTGSYNSLINKPTLFDGTWTSLTGKPAFAAVSTSGLYSDLTGKPTLFSGSFTDLTNKPATLSGYGITNAMSTSHAANGITSANITNWLTAYGWGNHSGLYRPLSYIPSWTEITSKPTTLTGYGITDAMSTTHVANSITTSNITNWNNKLSSYTETDPVFVLWNKSSGISITASQVSDFTASVTNNPAMVANTAKISYPTADAAKLAAISGTNTGDETTATIKTKLGVTTLSGSNTGDNAVNSLYSGLITNANHTGDVTGSNALTITNKVTMTGTSPVIITGTPTVIASSPVVVSILPATVSLPGSMSAADKTKLDGITPGAEVNVNPDWNATSSDAQILNKPTTVAGYGITDAVTTVGNQTIAGNKIFSGTTTVRTPVNATDAVNKSYVDSLKSKLKDLENYIYSQLPTPVDPIAVWKFDGNLNDNSGTYNLTSSGSTYEPGKLGLAFKFTGSEECYNTDVNLRRIFDSNNSWSVNLWFNSSIPYDTYTEGMGDPSKALFTCDGVNNSPYKRTWILTDQRGILFSRMLGSGNGGSLQAYYNFVPNTWYHVSVNFSGTTATIYINGSQASFVLMGDLGQDIGNVDANTTQITIGGNRQDNIVQWKGLIDQVFIYSRELTSAEVFRLYNGREFPEEEVVTDICGNTYKTVKIGTQTWMADNLKTSKYNDNIAIPLVEASGEWSALSTPGYCWYDNDPATNKATYGALYNWYTVNTGKLCPTGWHVPSDTEWTVLTDYLGGATVAGGKLKEAGLIHWNSPNTSATNESGFTALPGGIHNKDGTYSNIGIFGYWWSSTFDGPYGAWDRTLDYNDCDVPRSNRYLQHGFSVRCLKD